MNNFSMGVWLTLAYISTLVAMPIRTDHQNNVHVKQVFLAEKGQNGPYSGVDQHGNFFRGNSQTGFYHNYGTGITCYGIGQRKKCY